MRIISSKKPRTPVDLAKTNETQLAVVVNAPREYSQLAPAISLFHQTFVKIATDAATETIKSTMSHATALQPAERSFNYWAADVLEQYQSHGDIGGEQLIYTESLSPDRGERGHGFFKIRADQFNDFI